MFVVRNEIGAVYVVCFGTDAWCKEAYGKVWLDDGTILVMYDDESYAKLLCLDDGRRYTMSHDAFYDSTVPLE